MSAHDCRRPVINAQIWADLLLDQYTDHLSLKVRIVGQKILHQPLPNGLNDDAYNP
jgi:hypothetical protein